MPDEAFPQVAFLGFAERAAQVRDGETNALKWNVLGFKNILLVNFFPTPLNGWSLALAMRVTGACKAVKIRFKADSGEEIGSFDILPTFASPEVPLTRRDSPFLWMLPQAWQVFFFVLPAEPLILIQKQGRYFAVLEVDGNQEIVGEFYCQLVDPPALTPERVAAIKSNPRATRAVRAEYGCNVCSGKCRVYAALDRDATLEAEGFKWYQDIPERFVCECKRTQLDLSTVKRNFFALLFHQYTASGEIRDVPLYQKSNLESLRVEFANLLGVDPPEESLQKFIEDNPILLHQFPAYKLIPREMVGRVRGVVIAGRDAGNDASQLRRLKGSDLGQVTLLTYDDVAASLATLAQNIGAL